MRDTQPSRPDLVDLRLLTQSWRIRRDSEGLPVIPGRYGHVSAHDLTTLCVYLRGVRLVRKTLRALPPGWRRHQTGDEEANILAPVTDLDLACRVVRASQRRQASEKQRAALAAGRQRGLNALARERFKAKNPAISHRPKGGHPLPLVEVVKDSP